MSGAGKSLVLNTLEDQGYYCIDNLPIELLTNLFETKSLQKHNKVAVGIDIRSGEEYIQSLAEIVAPLKEKYKTDIVYLYAGKAVLIKRYDETRHKHPLSSPGTTLREALVKEYEVLAPIREIADIQIDTSFTTIYELSSQIITRICNNQKQPLSLMFQSFGFKYGTPRDSDYLFDVRCLPNPYWIPELRSHTGLEKEVIEWLSKQELVIKMEQELVSFIDQWVPYIIEAQRSYLTVSIGCTGGHHRSVYLTEQLAKYFRNKYKDSVIVKHRELEK
jgi:UPF0042 nucleotide-binding protein